MSEFKKLEISPSIAIVIAGAMIAAAVVFVNQSPAAQAQPSQGGTNLADSQHLEVPAPTAADHIIGSPTAPVVLIEYSDFQCPFCTMIYPTLKRLVEESNGQVAWVYRHLPLESIHPEAMPAAVASECITEQLGESGFWKYADAIFNDQKNIGDTKFKQVAHDLGADDAKFAACLTSKKFNDKIDANATDASASGGTGTPYTVIYGYGKQIPISGALPYNQIKAVIDALQKRQQ
ncbi:DsbA family protein [Candidatus Parcubacteria bacterium]|nr:DsbA family protein [Candidatus Parcubacteria bacterium]